MTELEKIKFNSLQRSIGSNNQLNSIKTHSRNQKKRYLYNTCSNSLEVTEALKYTNANLQAILEHIKRRNDSFSKQDKLVHSDEEEGKRLREES